MDRHKDQKLKSTSAVIRLWSVGRTLAKGTLVLFLAGLLFFKLGRSLRILEPCDFMYPAKSVEAQMCRAGLSPGYMDYVEPTQ